MAKTIELTIKFKVSEHEDETQRTLHVKVQQR